MANPVPDALVDAMPLLEKVAPTIATALGGPFAGTAINCLERTLGLSPSTDAQSVAAALMPPSADKLAAMKTADNNFALAMRRLDISVGKLDGDDRASARAREVTMKDLTPTVLAYVLTVGLFGFVAALTFVTLPTGSEQPLNLMLGSIATAWVAMISYYFGSSNGNRSKDLMLFNSVPVPAMRSDTSRSGAGSPTAPAPVARVPRAANQPAPVKRAEPVAPVAPEPAAPGKVPAPSLVPVAPAPPVEETIPGLSAALRAAAPGANTDEWLPVLRSAFDHCKVNTVERVAAALGQFAVEAGEDFSQRVENLRYTTPEQICKMFSHAFPDPADAVAYCNAPEKLANRVYAKDNKPGLGNGDEASGDGWRYRGRGLIQLTGRTTYEAFATAMHMSLEDAMAWCEKPDGAAMSGCWFLATHGCLDLADKWAAGSESVLDDISTRVNGVYCKTLEKRREASIRARQPMEQLKAAA